MAKHYFQKEQVNTKINGLNGVAVPFEVLPGNTGVLVLDDEVDGEKTLAGLLGAIVGRMGVKRITEEEYQDVKKKRLSVTFAPRSNALALPIRVLQSPVLNRPKQVVASPAAPSVAEFAALVETVEALVSGEPPTAPAPYAPRRGRPPKVKAPIRPSMAPVHEEIIKIR